jgi:hypothetical protein
MKKLLWGLGIVLVLAACADTFKDEAMASFEAVITADSVEREVMDGVAHIKLSADAHFDIALSAEGEADVFIAVMAQPFLDAGLDLTKTPDSVYLNGDMLVLSFNVKDYKEATDALSALSNVLTANRSLLVYHKELDHYGITLGDHKVEWAKNPLTNDKDAVIVLDGDTLTSWGVDLEVLADWVVMDMDGTTVALYPLDLK